MGFKPNALKDEFGRPRHVNLRTITDFYREDPMAMYRLFLPESNRTMPLYPHQRLFLKEAWKAQFVWLQMMRGGAKTYTVAMFAVLYALANAGMPIVFTAPTFRQALLAYDEALKLLDLNDKNENVDVRVKVELNGDPKRNQTESIIHFANGSTIRALPMGDGSRIRGIRGGVLIIDEFYQITEEMYESHIKPFVGVMQGGRKSKIIHTTTSWYQDCFAYKRLMQFAAEVKRGNKDYVILDFNLKDLHGYGFPLDKAIFTDALQHGSPVITAMTYFNLWPSTSSRWFDQKSIDYAISSQHNVKIEFKRKEDTARYFSVIDLAASEKGDSTQIVVWKKVNKQFHMVWAHSELGLRGHERAWLVHEVVRKYKPEFVIYDSHAAIGIDLKNDLAEKELLIKGQVKKVRPLVHHDAYNISGANRLLIPVAVNDSAVEKALINARDGTSVKGEAGLREMLFTKARDMLVDGDILGPGSAKEIDELTGDVGKYSGSEIEVLDVIRNSFYQLGNIGLRKDKNDHVMTSEGRLLFITRPGTHDDGAMCIVYGVIGFMRMLGRGRVTPAGLPTFRAMDPTETPKFQPNNARHQILTI